MTRTLPLTQARQQLPSLIQKAKKQFNRYIVTVNGSPDAIIMSVDEFESWQETMEILADPKLMQDLHEAEEDFKAGRLYDWEDVKKELGLDV